MMSAAPRKKTPVRAAFAFAALVSACSGAANQGLFANGPGDDAGGSPNGTGDAGPGGRSDGAPGEGAVPPVADDRIDPLAIGHTWVYDVTSYDGGFIPSCANGGQTSSVTGPGGTYGGAESVRYRPLCYAGLIDAVVSGDKVLAYVLADGGASPAPVTLVEGPVADGHTWPSTPGGGQSFTWRDAGTVSVPAGMFGRCWDRVYSHASTEIDTYCRGVGLVRVVSMASGYHAELASKNF